MAILEQGLIRIVNCVSRTPVFWLVDCWAAKLWSFTEWNFILLVEQVRFIKCVGLRWSYQVGGLIIYEHFF